MDKVIISNGSLVNGQSFAEVTFETSSTTNITSTGMITLNSVKIMDGTDDVTDNYNITSEPGTLTVSDNWCGDNVFWELVDSDNDGTADKLIISGKGDMYDFTIDTTNDIINSPWFKYREDITSVEIEKGITRIGKSAFQNCKNINIVTFAEGSELKSIGFHAFDFCESLTTIDIPSGVTVIEIYAFISCVSLTSVNIPENLTFINDGVFAYCESLTNVTIPANIKKLSKRAFDGCLKLKTVTFAEGSKLKTIGDGAFLNCGFKSITIPAGVIEISDYAFKGCTALETVVFAEDSELETIGSGAFSECEVLESIAIPAPFLPRKRAGRAI